MSLKVTMILPDDVDESFKRRQVVRMERLPDLGEYVKLTNKHGYTQPFKVTGINTWVKWSFWFFRWWINEPIELYLDYAKIPMI